MGIKKGSKVSAEFNMSSLTDIIFLLLIFFMLTSSLVTPNALNLQLPGKSKSTDAPKPGTAQMVKIERNGTYYYNGTKMSFGAIEKKVKQLKKDKGKNALITISPHSLANNDKVVAVMDAAYRYHVSVVLTEPR